MKVLPSTRISAIKAAATPAREGHGDTRDQTERAPSSGTPSHKHGDQDGDEVGDARTGTPDGFQAQPIES